MKGLLLADIFFRDYNEDRKSVGMKPLTQKGGFAVPGAGHRGGVQSSQSTNGRTRALCASEDDRVVFPERPHGFVIFRAFSRRMHLLD